MFWVFEILGILYILYCLSFCMIIIYTSIIEEWFCKNEVPIWYENFKMKYKKNYYSMIAINEQLENEIV